MSRATGGCHDHEHAARADHPQVSGGPRGRKRVTQPYTIGILYRIYLYLMRCRQIQSPPPRTGHAPGPRPLRAVQVPHT
eukprot:scaffold39497_cov62-Phaeocystis_antarctica.AAC.4